MVAVLVGYATERGSTRGVAERIAERLRGHGIVAEPRPMAEIAEVSRYRAIVLGSAIHGGRWLPDARQFVEANSRSLRERPVWLFSVSTVGDQESMFPARIARRLRSMRGQPAELIELVTARGHRNFAGAVSRSDWPATGRAFFRAMGGRYGDHRNWAVIDAWADSIAREMLMIPARPVEDAR